MYLKTMLSSLLTTLCLLSAPTIHALTMPPTTTTTKPLRVGVLYEEVQMSDLIGLDLLGAHTPKIMAINIQLSPFLAPLMQYTTPMEFLYISSSTSTTWVTPAMHVQPTHTYESAPRDLDILVIGGPNPGTVPEASLAFLREAAKKTKTILTTCTGAMWLAKSGVLDGKKATTNRVVLEWARELFPKVKWIDQRWVVEDGHSEGAQIWTAGGAGCGADMFIDYTDRTFNKKLVQLACAGLDFSYEKRKNQFYAEALQPIEL